MTKQHLDGKLRNRERERERVLLTSDTKTYPNPGHDATTTTGPDPYSCAACFHCKASGVTISSNKGWDPGNKHEQKYTNYPKAHLPYNWYMVGCSLSWNCKNEHVIRSISKSIVDIESSVNVSVLHVYDSVITEPNVYSVHLIKS